MVLKTLPLVMVSWKASWLTSMAACSSSKRQSSEKKPEAGQVTRFLMKAA